MASAAAVARPDPAPAPPKSMHRPPAPAAASVPSVVDRQSRQRHIPPRVLALILRHLARINTTISSPHVANVGIEALLVNRAWLAAGSSLLYRTIDVARSPSVLPLLTHTLLDAQASLPYALLVRSVRGVPVQDAGGESDGSSAVRATTEGHGSDDLAVAVTDDSAEVGDLDTLLQICPLLSSFTLVASPIACNILVQSLADNSPRLAHLSLRECPVTDALIKTLCTACPRLSTLDLSFTHVSIASAITAVNHLPVLSKLTMEAVSASTDLVQFRPFPSIPAIAHSPSPTITSLSESTSPSTATPSLPQTSLKSVNLRNSGAADAHIRYISQACPNIAAFRLDGCSALTDDAVVSIARNCPRLQLLDLSFVNGVADLGVLAIALGLKGSIEVLSLSGCEYVSVQSVQFLIDECCGPFVPNSSPSSMSPMPGNLPSKVHRPLTQLVLHGCPRITSSYLCEFDAVRSPNSMECMLESEALLRAVSVQQTLHLTSTVSTVTDASTAAAVTSTKETAEIEEDYRLDRGELWMLAAYNTSSRVFGSEIITTRAGKLIQGSIKDDSTSTSARSSMDSLDSRFDVYTATDKKGAIAAAAASGPLPSSGTSSSSTVGGKRDSINSNASSTASRSSTSKLPQMRPSKLATPSKLVSPKARAAAATGGGLPRPGFATKPAVMRAGGATASAASNASPPMKVNFAPRLTAVIEPTSKRISAMTQSSYSGKSAGGPGNAASARSLPARMAPTANGSNGTATTTATAGAGYKPRTFKKFNSDFADDIMPPRRPAAGKPAASGLSTPPARASPVPAAAPAVGSKSPGASRVLRSRPAAATTAPAGPAAAAAAPSSPPLSPPAAGLERWRRKTIVPSDDASSPSSPGATASLALPASPPAMSSRSKSLDKWRKNNPPQQQQPVSPPSFVAPHDDSAYVNSSGGGTGVSSLEKWRKPVVGQPVDSGLNMSSSSPPPPTAAGGGLEKWRKKDTATPGRLKK
ncbi:hypothetical protein HDU82_000012 [Entophlyctis luteolus]|nr:hypothetical protein HDU82_000012 [Entophlyctis luteolus]